MSSKSQQSATKRKQRVPVPIPDGLHVRMGRGDGEALQLLIINRWFKPSHLLGLFAIPLFQVVRIGLGARGFFISQNSHILIDGLIVLAVLLLSLNRSVITIEKGLFTVRHWPIPFPRYRRKIPVADIKRVYCRGKHELRALLKDDCNLLLLLDSEGSRAFLIRGLIETALGLTGEWIDGEYHGHQSSSINFKQWLGLRAEKDSFRRKVFSAIDALPELDQMPIGFLANRQDGTNGPELCLSVPFPAVPWMAKTAGTVGLLWLLWSRDPNFSAGYVWALYDLFAIGTCFCLAYIFLVYAFNRTFYTISPNEFRVRRGPLPFFKRIFTIPSRAVCQLYVTDSNIDYKLNLLTSTGVRHTLQLGSSALELRAIEHAIENELGIKNQTVDGECRPHDWVPPSDE